MFYEWLQFPKKSYYMGEEKVGTEYSASAFFISSIFFALRKFLQVTHRLSYIHLLSFNINYVPFKGIMNFEAKNAFVVIF